MSSTVQPFSIAEHVESAVLELDEPLLLSNTPQFPWESFTSKIAQHLELEGLEIQVSELESIDPSSFTSGLSQPFFEYVGVLGDLSGEFLWTFPEEDASRLLSWVLTREADHTVFRDDELLEAFARFATLESLQAVEELNFAGGLKPRLSRSEFQPGNHPLALSVTFTYQRQTCGGRLIFSHELIQAWMKKFEARKPKKLPSGLSQKIPVTLSLEIAQAPITLTEWKDMEEGDTLFLPSCGFDIEDYAGPVTLSMNGRSLLKARIKKSGKIKILDPATYQEISESMTNETFDEDLSEDFELSEDDFSEEELSEEFEEEETLSQEESEEEESEVSMEEEESSIEETSAPPEEPEAPAATAPPQQPLVSPQEVTVPLVIEAGRLEMTAEKLMEMGPGSVLDLQISPDVGVTLTIHGRSVARGELVKVGERLGVRILEKGS